ncbi:MAG: hypothetical protein P4L84_29275 [Isosphaeraceae bacterium]|nr:hypothetical protein [Isosphaeraceae bacterium]
MSADFDIPDELEAGQPARPELPASRAPSAPAPEAPAPLVIVEYRYRGAPSWLVLVLLIVLVGLGAAYYHRHSNTGRRSSRDLVASLPRVAPVPERQGEKTAGATDALSEPPTVLNGQGIVPDLPEQLTSVPAAAAAAEPATRPMQPSSGDATPSPEAPQLAPPTIAESRPVAPLPDPGAKERPHAEAAGLVPPAGAPAAVSPPMERAATNGDQPSAPAENEAPPVPAATPPENPAPPPLSPEEVERAIQREAEERQAAVDLMRQAKGEARRTEQIEGAQRAYDQRVAFHRELRDVLRNAGADAGKRIDELCDQYGRSLPPELRKAVTRRLHTLPDRSTHQDRVALLRAHDIPEPIILDDIARHLDRRLMNARGGVRTPDEVRVRAARQLLAFPVPPQRGAGQAGQP